MDNEYRIRDLMLSLPFEKQQLVSFLEKHQLRFEEDIQIALGVFDEE